MYEMRGKEMQRQREMTNRNKNGCDNWYDLWMKSYNERKEQIKKLPLGMNERYEMKDNVEKISQSKTIMNKKNIKRSTALSTFLNKAKWKKLYTFHPVTFETKKSASFLFLLKEFDAETPS